jgi:hypothetical protein
VKAARALAVALGLAGGIGAPGAARELWSRGSSSLELSGSVHEVATGTHGTDAELFSEIATSSPLCLLALTFPDCPAFDAVGEQGVGQSLTRVRTRLDARAGTHVSGVLVYDHEVRFGFLDTLGRSLGDSFRVDNFLPLEWEVHAFGLPTEHASWDHLLYRAYLKVETRRLEAVVGRQRIAWGVGRLWQPTDRFSFVPPLAVEPDQSPGVDAVDLRWNWSGFSFLEGVYQPNDSAADAAYGLRLHGTVRDVDYSLLAGRWDGAWATGGDLTGNLGQAAFRLEAIWTAPTRDVWPVGAAAPRQLASFWQVVVGVDRRFDLGSGLYVLVEHLYDGNALGFGEGKAGTLLPFFESTRKPPAGTSASALPPAVASGPFVRPASVAIFGGSRVISNARHQTGLQLGYDLTPVLRLDVLTLYDWNGRSAAFAPVLTWSPLGSLELTLGVQVFVGRRRSQYGPQEDLGYLNAEWFF